MRDMQHVSIFQRIYRKVGGLPAFFGSILLDYVSNFISTFLSRYWGGLKKMMEYLDAWVAFTARRDVNGFAWFLIGFGLAFYLASFGLKKARVRDMSVMRRAARHLETALRLRMPHRQLSNAYGKQGVAARAHDFEGTTSHDLEGTIEGSFRQANYYLDKVGLPLLPREVSSSIWLKDVAYALNEGQWDEAKDLILSKGYL
jgi:hypothetical protein